MSFQPEWKELAPNIAIFIVIVLGVGILIGVFIST